MFRYLCGLDESLDRSLADATLFDAFFGADHEVVVDDDFVAIECHVDDAAVVAAGIVVVTADDVVVVFLGIVVDDVEVVDIASPDDRLERFLEKMSPVSNQMVNRLRYTKH